MHLKRRNSWPLGVSHVQSFKASSAETSSGKLFRRFKCIVYITNKKYYEILTMYECVEKYLMTMGCSITMICLKSN